MPVASYKNNKGLYVIEIRRKEKIAGKWPKTNLTEKKTNIEDTVNKIALNATKTS